MATTIQIPDDLMARVEQMVSDGTYADSASVVRDALRLLSESQERARLIESIREADRSVGEGRGIPESDELWEGIRERSLAKLSRGEPINPDVMPLSE